jgi:flagellar biosynthesis/type III secretory pathway chaperone
MKLLLKHLLNTMEKKVVLYDKLISLLQEEWDSIAEYSIDALEPIIIKKDELVHQLQGLESDRTIIMKKVAKGLRISHGNLTMKNLLNIQKSLFNSRLAKSRKKLLSKIQVVNSLNQSIRELMKKSSESFRNSLVNLHKEGEIASSPYHANGKIQKSKKYSSMLSVDA